MKNSLPRFVILRGLPGAGKSTLAKSIQDKCFSLGGDGQHYEADEFHMELDSEGNWSYVWRQELLEYAHDLCRGKVAYALKNQLYSPSTVVVSNTSLSCNEVSTWLRIAYKLNLRNEDVHIVQCLEQFGSIHNVPDDKIEFMKNRFQSNDEIKELLNSTPYKMYTNYMDSDGYTF